MAVTRPQRRTYAHDGGKVVVGGGRDLQAGCPDVLHGGVKFIQLCCDGLLVHCTTWNGIQKSTYWYVVFSLKLVLLLGLSPYCTFQDLSLVFYWYENV